VLSILETAKKILGKIFWCFHKFNFYKLVALLGLILRVVVLPMIIPDFFELVFPFLVSWNMPDWLYQIVLRIFLFLIDTLGFNNAFFVLSYGTTGLCYKKKSAPALGSAYYTVFYFVYNLIAVLLVLYFRWWVILIIFVVYVILCFFLYGIAHTLQALPETWHATVTAHGIIAFVLFLTLFIISFFV